MNEELLNRIEIALKKIGFNKIEDNRYEYIETRKMIINNNPQVVISNKLELEYIGEGEIDDEPIYGYQLLKIKNENKELLFDIWINNENDFRYLLK